MLMLTCPQGTPRSRHGWPARPPLLCLGLLLGLSVPARAQIYTWHDANGNLVLSNVRASEGAAPRSYPVPQAQALRATRFVAAERVAAYDRLIAEHAQLNGVREGLVRVVVQVESAFNPYAVSPKGALGLMQLMPATAREFRVANPFSPSDNVRAGVAYPRRLLDRYDNNEELALAAYNAGPGAVDRHGQSVPPYAETRQYVSRVAEIAGQKEVEVPRTRIYRILEIIDGREVVRYTNREPN